MPETLFTSDERIFAETKEASYKKWFTDITNSYTLAENTASATDFAQIYVDENNFSLDPVIQGRVWAYGDFLKSLGRAQ